MKNYLFGILLGNALETFDYGVFSALTTPISSCFFPEQGGSKIALLATLGAFVGGFISRPLGGILFGYLGDRFGRKPALILSAFLMGISTIAIALLPCYDLIGVVSSALLFLFRFTSGISIGGELVGSILFMSESAPADNRRALYAASVLASAGLGVLCSFLVVASLNLLAGEYGGNAATWIWRLPFFMGSTISFIAIWLRSRLRESTQYSHLQATHSSVIRNPLRMVFGQYKRSLALAFGILIFSSATTWISYWFPTYIFQFLPHDRAKYHPSTILATSVLLNPVFFLCWGRVADYVGALRLMLGAALSYLVFSGVAFNLIASGDLMSTLLGLALFNFMTTAYSAPLCIWLVDAFPVHLRFSAIALAFNLAQALFGGTCQLVLSSLLIVYPEHYILVPWLFTLFIVFISIICCILSHFYLPK